MEEDGFKASDKQLLLGKKDKDAKDDSSSDIDTTLDKKPEEQFKLSPFRWVI